MAYSKPNPKKAPEPKKAPVQKFFVSGVVAAVWENKTEDGKIRHNATFERAYRTEEGYGQTGSYGARDLQNLRKAADLAHSWILEQRQQASDDPE